MDSSRISSFPPIADDESRVLVLGTMPGAESLRQSRYYAYEQNHFWALIFALHGLEKPAEYEARVRFLHEKRIALWDVLASCERLSSADSEIKKPEPNKVIELLTDYPQIEAIFLNGNGATRLFNKLVRPHISRDVHVDTLPSTSPAYAIPFATKLAGWRKLLEYLSKFQ